MCLGHRLDACHVHMKPERVVHALGDIAAMWHHMLRS
jgi:hypothetical protein